MVANTTKKLFRQLGGFYTLAKVFLHKPAREHRYLYLLYDWIVVEIWVMHERWVNRFCTALYVRVM